MHPVDEPRHYFFVALRLAQDWLARRQKKPRSPASLKGRSSFAGSEPTDVIVGGSRWLAASSPAKNGLFGCPHVTPPCHVTRHHTFTAEKPGKTRKLEHVERRMLRPSTRPLKTCTRSQNTQTALREAVVFREGRGPLAKSTAGADKGCWRTGRQGPCGVPTSFRSFLYGGLRSLHCRASLLHKEHKEPGELTA